MKILVCGSRSWRDRCFIREQLLPHGATAVIDGCAAGADSHANPIAPGLGLVTAGFPADWNRHGRAAGHIGNAGMLRRPGPDPAPASRTPVTRCTIMPSWTRRGHN